MANIEKLKDKIFEKDMNVTGLAEAIGIDKSTLYRKFKNNGEDISIKEASLIIKELNLSLDDVNSIFFNRFVAYGANDEKKGIN